MRHTTLVITLSLLGAYGCGAPRGAAPAVAVGSDRPMPIRVSAAGLPAQLDTPLPSEVAELARQGRPRAIPTAFAAAAGAAPGPRVFWVAYLTGPYLELRARAEDEGRAEAFDEDIEARIQRCEENDDVGDCEYCMSDCWETVPNALASTDRGLLLVRVSWPVDGPPVVDGESDVWLGDVNDTPTARVRAVEDVDADGRLELVLEVETATSWPAGDGGSTEVVVHYIDGDTLQPQLQLLESYEEDGHGGGYSMRTEVTRPDAGANGVPDFDVHYVREVWIQECDAYPTEEDIAEGAEPVPVDPRCLPADERYRAVYSAARDAWLLPGGQRWPWEAP